MDLAPNRRYHEGTSSQDTKAFSESEDSRGGHWKSKSKKAKSSIEEDELSQPWVCKEIDPFTPQSPTPSSSNACTKPLKVSRGDDEGSHNVPPGRGGSLQSSTKERTSSMKVGRKQNFDRWGDFRNQQRSERRHGTFTLLTKSPKEILALDKGKFKATPPMTNPVEKGNNNKFCEFHGEVGHNNDECMLLKRKIEELIKNGKLSHVIKELKQATAPLIGFSGEIIWPMGQIPLPVKIGDAEHFTYTWMNFVIVRSPSPYNGIIGRPEVRKIQAVPSTAHGMLKFPVLIGILTLRSIRIIPLECTMVFEPEAQPPDIIQAAEERIKLAIHPEYPEQTIAIGSTLTEEGRKALATYQRLVDKAFQKQTEKSMPFFKTLKKCTEKSDYQWTAKAKAAFKEMKKLIAELPTLTAPVEREELIVYLAAAREAAHTIIVITDQPIKQILSRPKVAGRLQKWSTELEEDPLDTPMEDEEELTDSWTLFTDGSSCVDGSEARLILTNTEGAKFTYALRFRFDATNKRLNMKL
uniref:Reverse transcriptase domain-containing protein n=1 Tax=Tanacetum cinerariifolium TaxID=118510 RepID=A0A699JCY7_TANCI|nr:reverse transcriptase domain-containing protein [Tanacetum cinerariifolium]